MKIKNLISFQNKKISREIQPNQKKYFFIFFKKTKKYFFKKYMKKVIKSTNQIKILFLWVDSDGPPYCCNLQKYLNMDDGTRCNRIGGASCNIYVLFCFARGTNS